jgi:hypothetical protein
MTFKCFFLLIKKLLLLDQALVTDTVRHYLKSPEHYGLIAREWTKRFVEAKVNSQLFCSNIALYTMKHLAVHIEAKVEKNKKSDNMVLSYTIVILT